MSGKYVKLADDLPVAGTATALTTPISISEYGTFLSLALKSAVKKEKKPEIT